jgi:hypothetical protein
VIRKKKHKEIQSTEKEQNLPPSSQAFYAGLCVAREQRISIFNTEGNF